MSILEEIALRALREISLFSRVIIRRPLRKYQLMPARAIVDSVLRKKGMEFAVMFPRQSGKNETQSQVEAYLLNLYQRVPGATIVKGQPTMTPQGINAMRRLDMSLSNDWNRAQWRRAHGYQIHLGEAAVYFFSGEPAANVAGATANVLLQCDEAQDMLEAEWDKKFLPMAASTNATRVYWGTAWTSRTFLARKVRHLRDLERQDGIRRVFIVTPDEVAAENPDYGDFVAGQVAAKGRNHPLIKTQYFNEEIDADGGMFPATRRALMQGDHPARLDPEPGHIYALLLDVAGADEGAIGERTDAAALENPKRDSTVLTIVDVDLASLQDQVLKAPTYRVVQRKAWTGIKHTLLYGQLLALAKHWKAKYLVADATGVGAGLVDFLTAALPAGVVFPFVFSSKTKSDLGWDFIGVCDTGRWKEHVAAAGDADGAEFWHQLEFCGHEVLDGPAHMLRWGVPDGTRDPATATLVHDDYILSAALAGALDEQPWHVDTGPTHIIRAPDPLADMDRGF